MNITVAVSAKCLLNQSLRVLHCILARSRVSAVPVDQAPCFSRDVR